MFGKANKPFIKSGATIATALLSLLLGLQIAVYARPMTACENGAEWIGPECSVEIEPLVFAVDLACIGRKCDDLYGNNPDAANSCIWCAMHWPSANPA